MNVQTRMLRRRSDDEWLSSHAGGASLGLYPLPGCEPVKAPQRLKIELVRQLQLRSFNRNIFWRIREAADAAREAASSEQDALSLHRPLSFR